MLFGYKLFYIDREQSRGGEGCSGIEHKHSINCSAIEHLSYAN